jgi:exosortase
LPESFFQPSKRADDAAGKSGERKPDLFRWAAVILSVVVIVWFYAVVARFGPDRGASTFEWLKSAWNGETDYEHGVLFPFVISGLIIYKWRDLRAGATNGSLWGLLVVLVGVLFFAVGYRTLQPRVTAGALPFLLWGSALYLWGWKVGKILLFPLFFFWLAIPLPSFQQATTDLQLIATKMAHHGSGLFGVETIVNGTKVLPVKGSWEPLDIAAGCSGIRSLMALLMISAAWAYVAKIAMWKKIALFISAFPLAILGNSLRVISIFVIAEYGDAEWASGSWHDWSGLLLFYPISLALLLGIHAILEGGFPWKRSKKVAIRRTVGINTESNQPLHER